MISQEPELIWQGRTQLGDEPGTFGDAAYSGLSTEFPLTVRNTGATSAGDVITFFLTAEHVKVFPGYQGHLVKVFWYKETGTPVPLEAKSLQGIPADGKGSPNGCRFGRN